MHQFIRVQAALHEQGALRLADQRDAKGRGRMAVRRIDDAVIAEFEPALLRHGFDLVARPHQDGSTRPISAASMAPRSEVSSQGCTTTVRAVWAASPGRSAAHIWHGEHGLTVM